MRIEWKPLRSPFNFSNRFDGGTRKSSNRLAALIASSLRFCARRNASELAYNPIPKQCLGPLVAERSDHFVSYTVYRYTTSPAFVVGASFRWKLGRWARAPSVPDLLIRAAFIPAAAFLASPPEIERPAPPFVFIGELDAGGALSAASFAAETIGFVLQKTSPPALTASALAASEGVHLDRHRSRR
jgi:hypothetical protein